MLLRVVAHVVLLGDSIFDNVAYVRGGLSVSEHLRRALPEGSTVTLLAVDGACAADVHQQLEAVPPGATHLILSAGGNDAYNASPVLRESATSVAEAVEMLGAARSGFRDDYEQLLVAVGAAKKSVAVCTVYDSIPDLGNVGRTALALFNDVILRTAFGFGVAVMDLRLVCTEPSDYSEVSSLEPSVTGGAKIARAIAQMVEGHSFMPPSSVFA